MIEKIGLGLLVGAARKIGASLLHWGRKLAGRRKSWDFDVSQFDTDRDLAELIQILSREGETLSNLAIRRFKEWLTERPHVFGDSNARRFISEDPVIQLLCTAARKRVRGQDIEEQTAAARAIYASMFDDESAWSVRIFEDAVDFLANAQSALLKPRDRLMRELMKGDIEEAVSSAKFSNSSDVDRDALESYIRSEVLMLRRQRILQGEDVVSRARALGSRLEQGLSYADRTLRAAAYQEVATVLVRSECMQEGEDFIDKAEAIGADVTPDRARVKILKGDADAAMRLLRDRTDNLSKGILIDAIRARDGNDAAIEYFEQNLTRDDLTPQSLAALATRYAERGDYEKACGLLVGATSDDISENPAILFLRARYRVASVLPRSEAQQFALNIGYIPGPEVIPNSVGSQPSILSAINDLSELQETSRKLNLPGIREAVEMELLFLKITSPDESIRAEANTFIRARLSNLSTAMDLMPFALRYGLEIDWAAVRGELEKAKQLGGWDQAQLRAALAATVAKNVPQDIADFIEKHRSELETQEGRGVVAHLEIQALVGCGEPEKAQQRLAQSIEDLSEGQIAFLKGRFAEAKGENSAAIRLAQYEKSGSVDDLLLLVAALGEARDNRLGEYLVRLWHERHHIDDARRACDVFTDQNRLDELDQFLNELGEAARSEPHLRTHLAWSLFRQGDFDKAKSELASLSKQDINTENTRQLTILIAIESGNWASLETYVQEELAQRENRSARELISAAQIAAAIKSAMAMPLAVAAVEKEPNNVLVNLAAFHTAASTGNDRSPQVNEWLSRAMAGASEDGPVYSKDLTEIATMIRESRAENDRLSDLITRAELPLALAMKRLNATQSAFVIGASWENLNALDSRQKMVLPIYAGNRLIVTNEAPKSIALDPMAILNLHQVGVLETIFDTFDDVVLPSGTLHCFFEDYGKASPVQPSRIAQAEELIRQFKAGTITTGASLDCDPDIAEAAGEEFAQLIAAAKAEGGYVVDTPPLRVPGLSQGYADPAPYKEHLVSPSGLVDALAEAGFLSDAKSAEAISALSGAGGKWEDEHSAEPGRPLYLSTLAVQYLSDASLLTLMQKFASKIVAHERAIELAEQELAASEAVGRVRDGIEAIRERLSQALSAGQARLGKWVPPEDGPDPDASRDSNMAPILSVFKGADGIEAFVCDDRSINKFPNFADQTGREIPILTSLDLLHVMHQQGILDERAFSQAIEALRLSGVGLVPVEPGEFAAAVVKSNWAVGASAELKAICEAILLPLARDVAQFPQERPWFVNASMGIAFGIRRAWQEIESIENAEKAADYLLDLLPDPWACSSEDQSSDREIWARELFRQTLWACTLFDLDGERGAAYQDWFERRLAPRFKRRDPESLDAVAKIVSGYFCALGPELDSHG